MFELKVVSFFSGAHSLRGYKGKCESVHGHNWKVEVNVVSGVLGKIGLVIDFKELKMMLNDVLDTLDHKDLNKITFFRKDNPSSENIACYIYRQLQPVIAGRDLRLQKVTVWEQRDSAASYWED